MTDLMLARPPVSSRAVVPCLGLRVVEPLCYHTDAVKRSMFSGPGKISAVLCCAENRTGILAV